MLVAYNMSCPWPAHVGTDHSMGVNEVQENAPDGAKLDSEVSVQAAQACEDSAENHENIFGRAEYEQARGQRPEPEWMRRYPEKYRWILDIFGDDDRQEPILREWNHELVDLAADVARSTHPKGFLRLGMRLLYENFQNDYGEAVSEAVQRVKIRAGAEKEELWPRR
jgi:hypothetical protein